MTCPCCSSRAGVVAWVDRYDAAVGFYKKDQKFRRENAKKTAEEMAPLSVGYSPYSGMTPLEHPNWADYAPVETRA